MPRRGEWKIYDAYLVEQVRAIYPIVLTKDETAARVGSTTKIVSNIMKRHGIKALVGGKRDQRGSRNSSWKGDAAKYSAFHLRVGVIRGKPSKCEHCGTTHAWKFEWANLTGRYEDVTDYVRLCVPCHRGMDNFASTLSRSEEWYTRSKRHPNGKRARWTKAGHAYQR